jgi:hypothetical protein
MEAKVEYFDRQSVRLFSREIRQILLVHANALNGDHFRDLVQRLRARGYAFISLDRALEDPAYASADTFTGAGGITWLHRWALTAHGRAGVLPGRPATAEICPRSRPASARNNPSPPEVREGVALPIRQTSHNAAVGHAGPHL